MTRRFRQPVTRTARRPLLVVFLMALIALLRFWWSPDDRSLEDQLREEGIYRVQRVVDGDTLLLEGGARVRLIGIDAPESVRPEYPVEPFGPEASSFTHDFVDSAGGRVRLRFDRQRKDRFDRFLAYVYHDQRMLNEELLLAGLARLRDEFAYSETIKRRFRRAEEEARSEGRGIWASAERGDPTGNP